MDGGTGAAVACVVVGSVWVLLCSAVVVRRVRFSRQAEARMVTPSVRLPEPAGHYGWVDYEWDDHLVAVDDTHASAAADREDRILLRHALRSGEPAVRRAAVAALAQIGNRHSWAVDGLIEALAERRDSPPRIAAALDRLGPRVGTRLLPLLGHPSSIVRFYAVRLLAGHGEVGHRLVLGLVHDPSPNVRAAALETLRTSMSGKTLRSALQLLNDPYPRVRAHACLTACAISGTSAAPFVVERLADEAWQVREAAVHALVRVGRRVTPPILPMLAHQDPEVRSGVALVLQDIGFVDELAQEGDIDLLERIFDAGGERLRMSAGERARRGLSVGRSVRPLPSGATS